MGSHVGSKRNHVINIINKKIYIEKALKKKLGFNS